MHLLLAVLFLRLIGNASTLNLSPALVNGNLSTATSSLSQSLTSPDSITSAPSISSAVLTASCPQCQVVARFGPLSMVLWWGSTLKLTLDTVSVLVTQYNNTAVTRTTTVYEDVSSVNISTLSEAQSLAFEILTAIDPEYEANGFALNNGTSAFIDGSFSVAYPTPFIGIQGFEYISVTQQDPLCPKGLQMSEQYMNTTECACMMQSYMGNPDLLQYTITSQITLSSTYYELVSGTGDPQPISSGNGFEMEGPVPINNVSYSDFIESVLGSEGFNKYRSCAFLAVGLGPPALMMPASALTATTTATVKTAGSYGVSSAKPESPLAPVVPPPTSTPAAPPSVPAVEPSPNKEPLLGSSTAAYVAPQTVTPVAQPPVPIVNKPSSSPRPAISPVNEPTKEGSQEPVESTSDSSGTDQSGSNGGQYAVEPPDNGKNDPSDTGVQPVGTQPSNDYNSGISDIGVTKSTPVAAVAISYAGSSITPDASSHYSIPQIGKLSPGGSPITTNNIIYSLAPSANALISNGQTISIPTFAAVVPDTVKQIATPVLTFAGSTYTADSSSQIIIGGQTIVPGGPAITVSSTPISLAHGASIAVVGGTTQSLYAPTAYPEMTFAGATYTANSDSAIIIQGQTLIPGSPAITISSTPISLAPGAKVAVIAGQTQSLTPAGHTAIPVITFAGSIYTANVASAFTIGDQTLSPGGIITVSNTRISLASGGASVVIAGSTQSVSLALAPTASPTFTFNGSTYTAGAKSEFVIGSQTLSEGGVVTVDGTPISYASNGGDVVVGTSTEAVNIGGLIMSGFGNGAATTTGPVLFTGGSTRCKSELPWWFTWLTLGGMLLLRLR